MTDEEKLKNDQIRRLTALRSYYVRDADSSNGRGEKVKKKILCRYVTTKRKREIM